MPRSWRTAGCLRPRTAGRPASPARRNVLDSMAPPVTRAPSAMMKLSACTPGPTSVGASGQLRIEPLTSDVAPLTIAAGPDVHVDHFGDRADASAPAPIRPRPRVRALGGVFGDFAQPGDETRPIAVQAQQVGELRRQFVEQDDFATAPFVEHFDFHAVAELGAGPGFQRPDVFDRRAVADLVVARCARPTFDDAHVVAHHAVDEAGVLDHGRFRRRRLRDAGQRRRSGPVRQTACRGSARDRTGRAPARATSHCPRPCSRAVSQRCDFTVTECPIAVWFRHESILVRRCHTCLPQ